MIEVKDIFPVRVASCHIGRDITDTELTAALRSQRHDGDPKLSENKYVFNTIPELESIYDFCAARAKEYIDAAFAPCYPMDFYVTQSWFTYLGDQDFIHRHDHQNCLFSGTFYLSCADNDTIMFHSSRYHQLVIDTTDREIHGHHCQDIQIRPGLLIFFPAHLQHSVPPKSRNRTRVCLAFNVFAKGDYGSEDAYNALYIK